jgi:hypothetical protein
MDRAIRDVGEAFSFHWIYFEGKRAKVMVRTGEGKIPDKHEIDTLYLSPISCQNDICDIELMLCTHNCDME